MYFSNLAKTESECNTLKFTTREIEYFLVKEFVNLKWFYDVCLELRMDIAVPDLGVEQLNNSACVLWTDLLRLVADIH